MKRLLYAILWDAVSLIKAGGRAWPMRPEVIEAVDWIMRDDWSTVFAFRRICEQLDLDPERMRTAIRVYLGSDDDRDDAP